MSGSRRPADDDGPARGLDGDALRPVSGARGSRPVHLLVVVAALAVAVTLLKPWDGASPSGPGPDTGGAGASASPTPVATGAPGPTGSGAPGDGPPDASTVSSCAQPQSWRTATIEAWGDRLAHVWRAADVSTGLRADPDLTFEPVTSGRVYAIGWCAPVAGDDRPPLAAAARLSMERPGEGFVPIPYRRIEPAEANALGELWTPLGSTWNGYGEPDAVTWPPGRYLIVLDTGRGWQRLIGIEIFDGRRDPSATAAPGGSGSPEGSGSPGATPDAAPAVTPGPSPASGGG